ncbi:chemotaxis protein CheB [Ramlibacter sp.]|uniref:chemotaxis protein CheB n=1 Tax=Ramlibacter sp. TaxID=1917967 RepID=UPI0017A94BE7|nr:chemotaxis protein CheB [Ramlibacter sp.]MBA2676199.1 chemotaxis protein CheB [Ramlibacter sp.]
MSTPLPVVGIGASAGGVEAMRNLFAHLPRDFPAALLVVLHLPPHSPSQLHRILADASTLEVSIGKDGEHLQPGHAYVATPDRHLLQDGNNRIRLSRGPKECRVRPAVDVLFRSLAVSCGANAAGVVLSGNLDDGTAGLWSLKEHGGRTFVQDPAEAMYDGMPQSAIAHVAVDHVDTAEGLAGALTAWARDTAGAPPGAPAPMEPHEVESRIANEANAMQAGVLGLGRPSKYSCPDCHGVLMQIEEGPLVRFRCHTGHAFSMQTLLAEVDTAIDKGLWATLRAIEERQLLLRHMAQVARQRGSEVRAVACEERASRLDNPVELVRRMVLDPLIFSHDVDGGG